MNQILQGDSLTRLKELESESVDCIITSPPYWALRDYKVDGQIGVEKTIDGYISNLIKIFDECKRVLKKDGTCWVVIGDTYASGGGLANEQSFRRKAGINTESNPDYPAKAKLRSQFGKCLLMIPERFAIAMIDKGWILRNKIIWKKNNCMPSSAKDRFTVDYEYIYFFTKSQKYYFKTQYENASSYGKRWAGDIFRMDKNSKYKDTNELSIRPREGRNMYPNGESRIKRCVWTINTKPFSEAHFAVFPEELVKQCIDAGCPSEGLTLDPFMGSGTVALVALKNNRRFLGIELNPDYIKIAQKRIEPYLKQEKLIFET